MTNQATTNLIRRLKEFDYEWLSGVFTSGSAQTATGKQTRQPDKQARLLAAAAHNKPLKPGLQVTADTADMPSTRDSMSVALKPGSVSSCEPQTCHGHCRPLAHTASAACAAVVQSSQPQSVPMSMQAQTRAPASRVHTLASQQVKTRSLMHAAQLHRTAKSERHGARRCSLADAHPCQICCCRMQNCTC